MVLFISCFISKVSARTITSDGTVSPVDSYHLEWRPLLQAGLFITAIFLVGAGWWFIRNAILYHGDFLALEARNLCVAATCTPEFHPALRQTYQNQGIGVFTMIFGTDYFTLLVRSFRPVRSMNLPYSYYIYETYYRIFILGLISCMLPIGHSFYLTWQEQKRRWFFNGCMLLACIIPIFLCIYYSYTWDFQPQGRYLMPMLPAFMFFVTLGICKLAFPPPGAGRQLKLRTLAEKLPAILTACIIFFTAAALLYSVLRVVVPHYLAG